MSEHDEESIRRRAHEISESDARGSDEENWLRAERESGEGGGPWAKTSSGDADTLAGNDDGD
jgi:hypothetical protein